MIIVESDMGHGPLSLLTGLLRIMLSLHTRLRYDILIAPSKQIAQIQLFPKGKGRLDMHYAVHRIA